VYSVDKQNAFIAVAGEPGERAILDTGATLPVVSRGYLRMRGLLGGARRAAHPTEIQTADGAVLATQELSVEMHLPSKPRAVMLTMTVKVLPTDEEIPFLIPLGIMRRAKHSLDFETGEGEFYPPGSVGTVDKMKWDDVGGCFSAEVKVFTVVMPRRQEAIPAWSGLRGRGGAMMADGAPHTKESGNGRTPGRPRGRC
jgi:hypothetical protein